jgi:hypothetical protein
MRLFPLLILGISTACFADEDPAVLETAKRMNWTVDSVKQHYLTGCDSGKPSEMADVLAVPASVAPTSDAPLEHLLFALKHEGLQLQAAVLALKHIDDKAVGQAFQSSPSSAYVRQICHLWELAHGAALEGLPAATGPYTPLFDPEEFITGPSVCDARWRVDFIGLGTAAFCPTVRRTPEIQALLGKNILASASEFMAGLDKSVLDRAVRWV